MKLLIALATVILAVNASIENSQWQSFKLEHAKTYVDVAEEQERYSIYLNNIKQIDEHNKKYEAGSESYYLAVNEFADMTAEEFQEMLGYEREEEEDTEELVEFHEFAENLTCSRSVDWRRRGAVGRVRNQRQCGSSWAFSAIGALEGQHYLKRRRFISLSEQELLDCSQSYNTAGCQGGSIRGAFRYIIRNGVQSERSYPYEAAENKCRARRYGKVKARRVRSIRPNERALKKALAHVGPISVAINGLPLQFYAGGIFNGTSADNSNLNHGVLAVGYGQDRRGRPYWIVKNSWGRRWGEKGYFRLARRGNQLGIANKASYPVL